MNKDRVKIIAFPELFIGGIIYITIFSAVCLSMIILFGYEGIADEPIKCQILFGTLLIAHLITCLLCMKRWFIIMVLTREGIEYYTLFRKPVKKTYNNFPYIYIAEYRHGTLIGIGNKMKFVVFSSRRLTDHERTHINMVAPTEDLLKIRYRKKRYEKLYNAVPNNVKIRLASPNKLKLEKDISESK